MSQQSDNYSLLGEAVSILRTLLDASEENQSNARLRAEAFCAAHQQAQKDWRERL